MIRSYRYRLRPTRAQSVVLMQWLALTRELYNAALQERRDAWKKQYVSVSRIDQEKQIPAIREVRPELTAVPIVVLRGALRRLDKAFAGFFRRCKIGETPGFPRFKAAQRWNSLLVDDLGKRSPIVAGSKRVAIPLLGKVKLHIANDRSVRGVPKAMRIIYELGKWYITFACVDVPAKLLPKTGANIGVDLGLHHFAATSDGELFENPRPLTATRLVIERAQRKVTRRKRGSKRRKVAVHTLARQHAHVANIRREHAISITRSLVSRYDIICMENLNVKGLARGTFAKSVHDVAWSTFGHWLSVKAEEAGRSIVKVAPYQTSQACSGCGVIVEKTLSDRVHHCSNCGLTLDRDVNAARNIKGLGLAPQGAARVVKRRLRSATSQIDDRVTIRMSILRQSPTIE